MTIPSTDHIIRWAKFKFLRKDRDENIFGIAHTALELRPDVDDAISVTWVEHFPGDSAEQFYCAVQATRRSMSTSPKSVFAKANVGVIHEICERYNVRVRIVHNSQTLNAGHSEIRRLPNENSDLLDLLAADAFNDWIQSCDLINFDHC